jgi:hypothetical protein
LNQMRLARCYLSLRFSFILSHF